METQNKNDRPAQIHLNVESVRKADWVRRSRAAGKKLSDWIIERVERPDDEEKNTTTQADAD